MVGKGVYLRPEVVDLVLFCDILRELFIDVQKCDWLISFHFRLHVNFLLNGWKKNMNNYFDAGNLNIIFTLKSLPYKH